MQTLAFMDENLQFDVANKSFSSMGEQLPDDGSTKLIGLYLADLLGCTAAGANKLVF